MAQTSTTNLRYKSLAVFCAAGAMAMLQACATTPQDGLFRVRSDFAAPLNADTGWAGEAGEAVTVEADRPFRLRMEVEARGAGTAHTLQVRRNAGAWTTVEAQGFPYPKREIEVDFAALGPGTIPPGWSVTTGLPIGFAIFDDVPGNVLRGTGGAARLVALYRAPWPLPEFGFETRFRLPLDQGEAFDLLFAYVDAKNHGRVRFDSAGRITVLKVTGGRDSVLASENASIAHGVWHEAAIQFEDGQLMVEFGDGLLEFAVPIAGLSEGNVGIAVPANGAVDLSAVKVEGVARTPGVSIVGTDGYADGDATADLLRGSAAPFNPGFGISLTERTPSWGSRGQHGEFEWPLVIRRYFDGAQTNSADDIFEFRTVDDNGGVVSGGANAQVRLAVPNGHLGGTFVENPGRIGPWQASNGDLYFIMEPAETDNKFMMMKSADGGATWLEVDGANRPRTGDLESVDGRLIGDQIHVVHQVTRSVRYHVFNTSDHPGQPDTWSIRDEVAAEADAVAQTATMAVRSDGSVVTFFLADRLHYTIRGSAGGWREPVEIDHGDEFINAGPQAILGRDDDVHLAYFSDDGAIWYRRLLADGTLTERKQLAQDVGTSRAEYGAVLPLSYQSETDTLFIAYRLANGTLWERQVRGGLTITEPKLITSQPVITDAVDSQQPAADLVHDGERAHALFVDEETRSIFSTWSENGIWQEPTLRVGDIEGSWVRGAIVRTPQGNRVYGYVFDAGSQGGSGFNRYAEFPLDPE